MIPVYVRVNQATLYTIRLYDPYFIGEFILYLEYKATGNFRAFKHEQTLSIIYKVYETMEDEINQVIFTNNHNGIANFFEFLKSLLEISVPVLDEKLIREKAAFYNEMEYSIKCDLFYLDEYIRIANEITTYFRKTVQSYIDRYDAGKYKADVTIVLERVQLPTIQENAINANVSEIPIHKKLKTKLSVKQISYLFRMLHDENIFETKTKTEVFNFISENFSTYQIEEDDISVNSIKKHFDTPEPKTKTFWKLMLRKMLSQSGSK